MMRQRVAILILSSLLLAGCSGGDKKAKSAKGSNKVQGSEAKQDSTQAAAGEGQSDVVEPKYQAETHFESTGDTGTVRLTMAVVASRQSETKTASGSNANTSSKEQAAESTMQTFNFADGAVCRVTPAFVKRFKGNDVWDINVEYLSSKDKGGSRVRTTSKRIAFDGKSPIIIAKDERHTLIFRPAGSDEK